MSVLSLLTRLKELGVGISLEKDQLKINAPRGKLTPDLLADLKKNKAGIIEFLRETAGEEHYSELEPVEEMEYYPLSSAQRRLYILQQMEPSSIQYNILSTFPIPDNMETGKLETAFQALIERHESLRTSFHTLPGAPERPVTTGPNLPGAATWCSCPFSTDSA